MYGSRMDTLTPLVADRVVAAMETKGATRLSMSEATGIPRTTLLRRLSGASSFTVAELDAIAKVLEVPVRDFIGDAA